MWIVWLKEWMPWLVQAWHCRRKEKDEVTKTEVDKS